MEIYKTTEEINVIFKFLRREEKWKEFKNPVTFNRTTQQGQQVSREGCVRGEGCGELRPGEADLIGHDENGVGFPSISSEWQEGYHLSETGTVGENPRH